MLRIKNFFNDYKNNKFTIHLGESRNLLHESDLQKKAKNISSELSPLGYVSSLYEKTLNKADAGSEIREYVLYLRKKNRFFPSEKLLNLKSRFSDNLRKVNAL